MTARKRAWEDCDSSESRQKGLAAAGVKRQRVAFAPSTENTYVPANPPRELKRKLDNEQVNSKYFRCRKTSEPGY